MAHTGDVLMSSANIFKFVNFITKGKYYWVGWFNLRRICYMESPWFYSIYNDSITWGLTIHAYILMFELIGPFGVKKVKKNVC